MPRLFLAIPLPWEIKQTISDLAEEIKKQMPHSQINWVEPENYHITLHFLGDVHEEKEEQLIRDLRGGKYPQSFKLTLKEVSAFPNKKSPRTIFVETDIHPFAVELYRQTGNVLVNLGFELDRRAWASHITIGRVKVQSEVLKPELVVVPPQSFEVSSFVLMASTLTADGSFYDIVEEVGV